MEIQGSPTHDDDLLQAAGRSEGEFIRLYTRFQPLALRICLRVLRDQHQAEEVVQEMFAKVWTRPGRFDRDRGSAAHWIAMSARSMAIERVRSAEASRRRDSSYQRLADRQVHDDPVIGSMIRIDDDVVVRTVLDLISDRQREAITLSFFDHLTHTEISERLGVPLGTVKTRIRDGLIAMRWRLAVGVPAAA